MNTPPGGNIQEMAAGTMNGGGACLFALDPWGHLWFSAQVGPGGKWDAWQGPKFEGQPAPGLAIACAGQNDGLLMLVMLDDQGMAWTLSEASGGGWGQWQGPGIGGEQFSYASIAAGEQSGLRGIQLLAADGNGGIWSCYQMNPGADWSGWTSFALSPKYHFGEVALGGQNNGCLMLIAESAGSILALPQTQPGGVWGNWNLLNPSGAPMVNGVCACQQGGNRGVQVWGLDTSADKYGQVWTIYQDTAGGQWDPWYGPGFQSQPEALRTIAAAGQGNGCTVFLGVGITGNLWAVGQTAPGGDWGSWAQLPAPPSE